MTATAKVSVVIAAYNCAGFVHRAIGSALDQKGVEVEVLVVDDASSDGTAETILALAAKDSRIRLLSLNENGGPSAARNAGFAAATGDWIAVLDADDAFEPGRLSRLVTAGRAYDADLVADNFRYFDARTGTVGPAGLRESGAPEIIGRHTFVAAARPFTDEADYGLLKPLFRREFFVRHELAYPVHTRHGEDFLLYLECLLRGGRFLLVRYPGYLYTTRQSGLSRTLVDYAGQVQELSVLALRPEIAGDARLLSLLNMRGEALQRLQAERELETIVARKDVGALLSFATRPNGTALAGRWAIRAVRRKWRMLAGRAATAG